MNISKSKIPYLLLVLVIIISAAVIFNNLGSTTIWCWDEARQAENALEILKTGEWVVIQYGGKPDLWNLKGPLPAWLVAISFKIFGLSEFALRFWSALFGVATIVIVYLFGSELKNKYVGLYAALILLSTQGFIGYHGARTGDRDVMVTFFITLSLYLFYINQRKKHLLLPIGAAISVAFGFLTKGVAILAPIIMALYLLYFKSLKKAIFSKETKYAAISFFVISAPWFILRFIRGKDFFIRKIQYDIIKRFSTAIEEHTGTWFYYFSALQARGLGWILLILLITAFIYALYLFKKKDRPVSLLIIWISLFLIILSFIKTKLFWYIIPVYPAISLLIAYNIEAIQESLRIKKKILTVLFLIVMIIPFTSIIRYTEHIYISPAARAIKDIKGELSGINALYIHKDENNQSIFFYLNAYMKGNASLYKNLDELMLKKGDAIITFDRYRSNALAMKHDYQLIIKSGKVSLFRKI